MNFYRWEQNDLILKVKIQPRAKKDEIAGILQDRLKIRIKSPAVDGKANAGLIHFLADLCEVKKSDIEIIRGKTNTEKLIRIKQPKNISRIIE